MKYKVIHIITRLDKGGAAENTYLTYKLHNREKYEVKIITGLNKRDIEVILIPEFQREINLFLDLVAFYKIYKILRKEKPYIVHTHTSKTGILGRWAAKFAGVPVIIHTPHGHIFYGYFNKLLTLLFILIERLTSYITDYIITLTKKGKEEHIKFKIAPPSKFIPIYSGIEFEKIKIKKDKIKIKKELKIPDCSIIIGSAGRLEPIKGFIYLIKSAEIVLKELKREKIYFIVAGDGSLKEELQREVVERGIERNFKFIGWREDVYDIINISDIFVLPSLNEGMGRVILEAMYLGKPIIASKVGGIPEIVIDGENGLLFESQNYNELAEKIIFLIKNPDLLEKMGENSKNLVRKREFSAEGMVEKIEELYEKSISKKHSAFSFMCKD